MNRPLLVLGVDGGGTKSIGLISDQSGRILSRQEAGASNPNVVGVDASAETLFNLISSCCEEAGCSAEELRNAVLGLAGAGGTASRDRVLEALEHRFVAADMTPPPLVIENDARIALEGAFDGGAGVVAIAGTGSVVIGKSGTGDVHLVGGWGRLLGDEGSGYAIGRDGVRAVIMILDRRGEPTRLTELFALQYRWKTREDIIEGVYHGSFDLATLARCVMEAAANHDLVSQKILQNAAAQLVDQIRAVVMRMGILRKVGLVMSGGLLERSTVFSNVLQLKIMRVLPQVEIRQPLNGPAQGALRLALDGVRKT